MKRIQLGAILTAPALLLLLGANTASATVVASPGALHPNSTLIDFENIPVGVTEPLVINGVTITTYERHSNNPGPGAVDDAANYPNLVEHPGIFGGHFFAPGIQHFRIEFATPVSQAGLGILDPNFDGNELLAFDSAGNLLAGATSSGAPGAAFATGPVGGSHSTFVGFVRPSADISYLELHHVGLDLMAIDNIMYFGGNGGGVIPEPTSLAMVGVIGCALAGFAWRKRRK